MDIQNISNHSPKEIHKEVTEYDFDKDQLPKFLWCSKLVIDQEYPGEQPSNRRNVYDETHPSINKLAKATRTI